MSWVIVAVGVGTAVSAGGAAMSAKAAKDAQKKLAGAGGPGPDVSSDIAAYFSDVEKFMPQDAKFTKSLAQTNLDVQESMLPGIGKERATWFEALSPLLRGELPKGTLDAFMRSGAASSVGSGFGGSGFGFVNQGLFGARGSLGAMQQGYGLLGALLSTMPQTASAGGFLSQITPPQNRSALDSTTRGQNISLATGVAQLPTSGGIWGSFMQQTGGRIAGLGISGAMGGGAGAAAGAGAGGGSAYNAPGATGWMNANFPAGS